MSGGHFDYQQHHIRDIADSIEGYLNGREVDEDDIDYYLKDPWLDDNEKRYLKEHKRTIPNQYEYSKETLTKMRQGLKIIRKAYIYAQRIDWLLSGDDGERWHERELHLFTHNKPERRKLMGDWIGRPSMALDSNLFPDLTWDDDPIEVELTIKRKNNGNNN